MNLPDAEIILRRTIPAPESSLKNGVRSIDDFAPPKEKKKRGAPSVAKSRREKFFSEMEKMRQDSEWDDFRAGHFVALYAACHEHCYGILPAETETSKDFALAMLAASRLLKNEFQGNPAKMVHFMRWSWSREQEREKWRRSNGNGGGRLSWRFQFSSSHVSDYRVNAVRSGVSKK